MDFFSRIEYEKAGCYQKKKMLKTDKLKLQEKQSIKVFLQNPVGTW